MIYDIFTFNNELDALELRLNILNEYVDYFVIVEATETFSRKPKVLSYLWNKERFKQWENKIKYFVIDRHDDQDTLKLAISSDNTGYGSADYWVYEFYQKEKIKEALVGLNNDDVCFVSDVDEIWNPNILPILGDDVYKPKQDLTYIYYVNLRTSENWKFFTGTIVTKYKNIKNECLNHLRTHSKNNYTFIENGGWHFNALGGAEKKIKDFEHPVYTRDYMKSREVGATINENGLPDYLLNNREKYKHLFI